MTRIITLFTILFLISVSISTAQDDALLERSQNLFQPLPQSAPEFTGNRANQAKLKLGKMLFFDPRLSASHLISCNSCHNIGLAGGDLQETSVGHNWQKGPRNAPTVMNAVFNVAQFWDGRAKDLAEQAKGPVQASVEMNNTPERVIATLRSLPVYIELFRLAFPDQPDSLTFDNVANAIEVFEATLLTPAPFDRYLTGDRRAMDNEEKAGLALFIDKGCAKCHGGINIGGNGYFPFGVIEKPDADVLPPGDKGRFQITNTASDAYVFRAPSLRNVALTAPYFHSGKVWSLVDAVSLMGSAQLGITLDPIEEIKLLAFMNSLNGTQPEITYPVMPPSTPETPKPVLE